MLDTRRMAAAYRYAIDPTGLAILISWTSKSRPDRAPPLRFTFFWVKG